MDICASDYFSLTSHGDKEGWPRNLLLWRAAVNSLNIVWTLQVELGRAAQASATSDWSEQALHTFERVITCNMFLAT